MEDLTLVNKSLLNELSALLLKYGVNFSNLLSMETIDLKTAKKTYGFDFMKKGENPFYYVRYKEPDSKKWFIKKTTNTDNEKTAVLFAITNRDEIIEKYKKRKAILKKNKDSKELYKMLEGYYVYNSNYLQDDRVNNKRELNNSQMRKYYGIIKNYIIPYLEQEKIKGIEEINKNFYSGLKLYLLEKIKNKKAINNYLMAFNRILQYCERNGLIDILPYSKGNGMIRITKEDKAKERKPALLNTEYLKNIFDDNFINESEKKWDWEKIYYNYLLSMFGLCFGLRDSEIGRIKRKDIEYKKETGVYILKVWNHKTEHFNTAGTEHRKFPVHPFIVKQIRNYLEILGMKGRKIGLEDYLFGKRKTEKETGKTDGKIYQIHFYNALVWLYKRIRMKEAMKKESFEKGLLLRKEDIEKEIKGFNDSHTEKIVFYSTRHTFQTLLATKYKGLTLLIDYFMGHKPAQTMLSNYLHINQIDDKTYMNEYGNLLIDFQNQFFFYTEKEEVVKEEIGKRRKEYFKKALGEKQRGGTIKEEDVISSIEEYLSKDRKKEEEPESQYI